MTAPLPGFRPGMLQYAGRAGQKEEGAWQLLGIQDPGIPRMHAGRTKEYVPGQALCTTPTAAALVWLRTGRTTRMPGARTLLCVSE